MRRAIASEDTVDVAYFQLATLRELTPVHLDVLRIIASRQVIAMDARSITRPEPPSDAGEALTSTFPEPGAGIEPTTSSLQEKCSAN